MREIILVGNPNTGKTTLFNSLTKSFEHIGNWNGVTVEEKQKIITYGSEQISVVDLPGLYSLSAYSYEEKVAVDYIFNHPQSKIVYVCDAHNLRKNMYLLTELTALNNEIIVLINDMGKILKINNTIKAINSQLGCEAILLNADKLTQLNKQKILSNTKINIKNNKFLINFNIFYKKIFKQNNKININNIFLLYKILQSNFINPYINKLKISSNIIEELKLLEQEKDALQKISKFQYDFIDEHLICENPKHKRMNNVDKLLLHPIGGIIFFLIVIFILLYTTFFSLGSYLSSGLQQLFTSLIAQPILQVLYSSNIPFWLFSLFENAVFNASLTVLGFLPQIVLLFLFLSILEDTGYISRIAFLFDELLEKVGLSGKSIYTLILGLGCTTSATMTARNLEDKNAKIKTALATPYISCSAKLPIYLCISSVVFGANNIFIVFGIYILGFIVSLSLSGILNAKILPSKKQTFIMEFPEYRLPKPKRIIKLLIKNIKEFSLRIFTVMISINVILWILQSFSFSFSFVQTSGQRSMMEVIASFIAPLLTPLGLNNYAVCSALIVGIVAKELIMSTMLIFNGGKLSSFIDPSSAIYFSPASALSFLVFSLLYSPCVATLSVLRKEVGKKWTFLSFILHLVIAYLCAFVVYTFSCAISRFGIFWTLLTALGFFIIAISCFIFIHKLIANKKRKCLFCEKNCSDCKR